MKKLVITAELDAKIKELQKENKSLIVDKTLNDNGPYGSPSPEAAPFVDEVFDLCYNMDYKEELKRLVHIFGYEYRLGQVTAYMQLYGYEIKEPKLIKYVACVESEKNKVYYGKAVNCDSQFGSTRFYSNDESDMKKLEELEKHGWKREEYDPRELPFEF